MRKYLLAIAIVIVLFISSGQTYEQQSLIPTLEQWLPDKPLEGALSKLEIPYWGKQISVEERGYYHFVEFLLRKAAHFFIFGLLAIGINLALPAWKFRFVLTLLLTLVVAAADEYHQSLTGGRTPSGQDVLLDMTGAFICLLLFRLVLLGFGSIRTKRKKLSGPLR